MIGIVIGLWLLCLQRGQLILVSIVVSSNILYGWFYGQNPICGINRLPILSRDLALQLRTESDIAEFYGIHSESNLENYTKRGAQIENVRMIRSQEEEQNSDYEKNGDEPTTLRRLSFQGDDQNQDLQDEQPAEKVENEIDIPSRLKRLRFSDSTLEECAAFSEGESQN